MTNPNAARPSIANRHERAARLFRNGCCAAAVATALMFAAAPGAVARETGAAAAGEAAVERQAAPADLTIVPVTQSAERAGLPLTGISVSDGKPGGLAGYSGAILAHRPTDLTTIGSGAASAVSPRKAPPADGDIDIDVGEAHSTDDGVDAIHAYANSGTVTIKAGTVSAGGFLADGISATTNGGDIHVEVGDVTVNVGDGLEIRADYGSYTGNATIHAGNIKSNGAGITALAGNNVTIVAGNIETHSGTEDAGTQLGQGVKAVAKGSIGITVGDVTTTGYWAEGVYAVLSPGYDQPANGGIVIETGAVTTSGIGSSAIVAVDRGYRNGGNGLVSISAGPILTTGDYASGIYAVGSNIAIEAKGPIETRGHRSTGVYAAAVGGDASAIAGPVTTKGDLSTAVRIFSRYGNVEVTTTGPIRTEGRNSYGVLGFGGGNVTIDNSGDVATGGTFSKGIYGLSEGGSVLITNSGDVHTAGFAADGIRAIGTGDLVHVETRGTVRTDGDYAIGIVAARSRAGRGDRDDASLKAGTSLVEVKASSVITSGSGATGVVGVNYDIGGSVSIAVEKVVTSGFNANGVVSRAFGDISIQAGSVHASGSAIYADAIGGDGTITVTGSAVSSGNSAIQALSSFGTQTINIKDGAQVVGGGARDEVYSRLGAGIFLNIYGGSATINNSGLITTTGQGFAIETAGGVDYYGEAHSAIAINNSGSIVGGLKLSEDADTLDNRGLVAITRDSDFGGGQDVWTNSGTLRIDTVTAGTAALAARSVSVNGLEIFRNSGLVDLRNGVAGDRLSLSGDYRGSGDARLGLDIGNGKADTLAIGGNATGSTAIVLAGVGSADARLLGSDLTLVTVGGASDGEAFRLANGEIGLIGYSLSYDAASKSYRLAAGPGGAVHRLGKLGETTRALWSKSADAWSAHNSELRDGRSDGKRLWGQMFGGVDHRSGYAGGYRLDYRQDAFGAQLGLDLVAGDTVHAGAMTGFATSKIGFSDGGERLDLKAFNVGGYAGVRSERFFANALVKYDRMRVSGRALDGSWSARMNADVFGAAVEAGTRFGSDSMFVEPTAAIAWTSASLDDFELLGQRLDFGQSKGLRGSVGARLGAAIESGPSKMIIYASGRLVHEFEGKDGVVLASGGTNATVRGDAPGDHAELALGINILSEGPVSGFVEGNARLGDGNKGGGGRAGIRIKF